MGILLHLEPEPRVFEVTYPKVRFTNLRDFVGKRPYRVMRRVVNGLDLDYPDVAVEAMREAARRLTAEDFSHYDVGQLLNHILMDLLGVSMSKWTRLVDFSAKWRVCSAGVAYVEEWGRRTILDAVGVPNLGARVQETRREAIMGQVPLDPRKLEPWPRAFRLPHPAGEPERFIHVERVKPADYSYHPDYRLLAEGRAGE